MADPRWAEREAEALLKEWGVNNLPANPWAIAADHHIDVWAMPPSSEGGVSGVLLRRGNAFGILYATHIENEGFQRFSVSHELGHYFLPGHTESVIINGVHQSKAGFVSDNQFEQEADHFAAGFLMPAFLFDPALRKAGEGLEAVQHLAARCETSLTSTAIRFAQRTPDVAAIVVSRGDRVEYCFMSDTLKEYPGLEWLKKGTLLPRNSVTVRFNADDENIRRGREDNGTVELQSWFGGKVDGSLYEEVKGLGRYGRSLSILTASDLPDLDELEEEEELREAWPPRFRR